MEAGFTQQRQMELHPGTQRCQAQPLSQDLQSKVQAGSKANNQVEDGAKIGDPREVPDPAQARKLASLKVVGPQV